VRVQVVYNFYLDYRLPRLDTGKPLWLTLNVNVDDPTKRYDAFVRTRGDEDELFYAEIGASLASGVLPLQPVDRPEEALVYRVRDRVVDRLLVALEWDADTAPVDDPSCAELWRARAVDMASGVLKHLRVVARSPRVQIIQRRWHPSTQKFTISHPHTEEWFNKDDGERLPIFDGNNSALAFGLLSPESGVARWDDLQASIGASPEPALHLSLLVDAEEALASVRLREAVLSAASACEVSAKHYGATQTKISKTQFERLTAPRQGAKFADRYYEDLPYAVAGQSLRTVDVHVFDEVAALYYERNAIMHGGQLSDGLRGKPDREVHLIVESWLSSARRAAEWIEALPR